MRAFILGGLALIAAACGSSSSQTGQIGNCSGVTLTGPGAFTPLSGFAYQNEANLGAGASAAGTYEVVIWAGAPDAGTPNQSEQSNCSQLLAGAFSNSLLLFVPPQTLEFNLQDSFSATSYSTVIFDLTEPLSESSVTLEDILGSVNLSTSAGATCLSGNFTANLVPVNPVDATPVDGGAVTPVYGTFSLPYCH